MTAPAPKQPQDRKPKGGAKQPQDRKPKGGATAAEEGQTTLVTVDFHGHTYEVDWSRMDDIDVFEAMASAQSGGGGEIVGMVYSMKALLGSEYDRWKTEQKAVHGRVGSELMAAFMEAAAPGN